MLSEVCCDVDDTDAGIAHCACVSSSLSSLLSPLSFSLLSLSLSSLFLSPLSIPFSFTCVAVNKAMWRILRGQLPVHLYHKDELKLPRIRLVVASTFILTNFVLSSRGWLNNTDMSRGSPGYYFNLPFFDMV